MNIDYNITTARPDKLRTLHIIVIDGESLATTKAKEILHFAKNRNIPRYDWKQLKEAVRLGNPLSIR
jgi:hypothetical protein